MISVQKIVSRVLGLMLLLTVSLQVRAGDDDFPPRPSPPVLMNDLAGIMSADQQSDLEEKLDAFDKTSSTQIAVVTIKSIGDYDAGDYAIKLGNKWGVGKAGKNNGILILLAMSEHKVFIATGRGLEGALTDYQAGKIRDEMVPYFKQGNYYEGLSRGIDDVIAATKGEYKADKNDHKGSPATGLIVILIVLFIVWIVKRRGGGGGGSYMSGRGFGGFGTGWIIGSGLGSGGWGGGGSSGGGGGGFGGFGGGSFGGGGAGGSW